MKIEYGRLISIDENDIIDGKFVVPDGVTSIGDIAFQNNQKLKEIIIPEGVKYIWNEAFQYCENLTSVKLPQSLVRIGRNAFDGCLSLQEIVIPDNATEIGHSAFSNCIALSKVTLPKYLDTIAAYLFINCRSLKEISIPNSVYSIGECAFKGCSSLKEVISPDRISEMGEQAFERCVSLERVTLPKQESGYFLSKKVFSGCLSLKEVEIQEGLIFIDECAFENCESLQEINLPNSVHTIGMSAFANCVSLSKIVTPESVSSIGESCFENCQSLSEIDLQNNNINIESNAFLACSNVKSIKMPTCSDFYYIADLSTQLEEIKNPDEEKYKIIDGVLYSKDGTELVKYPKYLNATSFTVPNGVKFISYRAFENCTSLEKVVLPDGLSEISGKAFAGCSSLKEIKLPNTLIALGEKAFVSCKALKNIEIPDSIGFVGSLVFEECESLEKVKIFGEEISLEKFNVLDLLINCNSEFVKYAIKNKKFLPKRFSILSDTPYTEIENYYKCSKAWAAIQKEYISLYEGHQFSESISNLYQLCVVLGFFHQNRTNEVMDFIRKNIFSIEPKKLHEYLGSMDTSAYGFVEEFADFFMQNYHAPRTEVFEEVGTVEIPFLWYYDEDLDDLVNCVGMAYENWIRKVKAAYPNRAVMAHREAESETESFTEECVLNALNSKEYDFSPGFEELAQLCGPYNYSDENYKNLENWFEKAKSIKPEDMVLRAESDDQSEGITFKLLAKDDERTAILGELTNCCQVVDNAGSECLHYGLTSENSGFVEFNYNGRIIGQSWVWYNPETQIVCLDNIEVPVRLIPKLKKNKTLYENFIDCLNRLAISFKQSMEKKGYLVKGVTIGSGYTDLDMLDKYYSSVNPQKNNEYLPPKDYTGYSDATHKQYVIADFTKEKTILLTERNFWGKIYLLACFKEE